MRDFQVSIRTALSAGAVLLVLLAAAIVHVPWQITSRANIGDLNARLNAQTVDAVGARVTALLDSAVAVRDALGLNLRQGVIDAEDKTRRDALFLSYLLSQPGLTAIELARPDNSASNARRGTDGTIRIEETLPGDPPTRQLDVYRPGDQGALALEAQRTGPSDYRPTEQFWYLTAFDQDQPTWSNIYRLPTTLRLGVTTPQAVEYDGAVLGVVGVTISLDQLSRFLDNVTPSPNGAVFLTNVYGELVAAQGVRSDSEQPMKIARLGDSDAPAVRLVASALATRGIDLSKFDKPMQIEIESGGENWFVTMSPLAEMGLIAAVVIPEADVFGTINRNSRALMLALAALVPAILALAWFASRALIAAPLARVTANLRALEDFSLARVIEIPSHIAELRQVTAATQRMSASLASFRKYIPTELVRTLFAMGMEAAPGGERRELTILFMDLQGFTALSERMGDEVIGLLGEYLSEMSACIAAHGGTIDKFIGDAVMAFWGAPAADSQHALHACQAALACQERMAALRARGGPWANLRVRIGVNTGAVLVGNVGSADRLNYTVIGDPVNVASRLEALNKLYSTGIIIGEATLRAAGDQLVVRPLDRVAVYGKEIGVEIHELLGVAGAAPSWVASYEQGRAALYGRDWATALTLFEQTIATRGGDRAAEIQIGRAREFQRTAPPPEWNGLVVLDQK